MERSEVDRPEPVALGHHSHMLPSSKPGRLSTQTRHCPGPSAHLYQCRSAESPPAGGTFVPTVGIVEPEVPVPALHGAPPRCSRYETGKARCCLFHTDLGGLAVSTFSLPHRSGCPGSMRSERTSSLTHHTSRDDSPPKPILAKLGMGWRRCVEVKC